MSSPLVSTPVYNLQTTVGALAVGLFISCFLFGISTVQTYLYYTHFPDDRAYLKAMVRLDDMSFIGY